MQFLSLCSKAPFTPSTDIPQLDGKVILITGANTGLGKEQLRHLARYGGTNAKFYMAARSRSRAELSIKDLESSIPDLKIHFLELDLSSLASVKAAVETFKSENDRLDILVNNAGVMALDAGLTKDGYEIQFGTNYIGHYLLTRELLPLLEKTAAKHDVRIVNLSSLGHNMSPAAGFLPEEVITDMANRSTWARYGQSKLANILHTKELARRYPNITSIAIHPGLVNTNLSDSFAKGNKTLIFFFGGIISWFSMTPATGALNQTWASVAPVVGKTNSGSSTTKEVKSGEYYTPVTAQGGENALGKDVELAERLWNWTEKEMTKKGY